ncbi:MAG TPA: hypothetical protein PKH16_00230 [Aequorivita sp.]|nr:hypothetical protein [Aequorivita sp.]
MKIFNIITLIFLSTLIISCNEDENSPEPETRNWTAILEDACGVESSQLLICITKEEKDRAVNLIVAGEPCNWITITDIRNDTYSGFWRGATTDDNYCVE